MKSEEDSTMRKSRRLRWEGLVAIMEEDMSAFKIFTGKHERDLYKALRVNRKKILEWMLKKCLIRFRIGLTGELFLF
jgi:hypothetical protein